MNDLNAQMGRILKFTSTLQGSYSRINRAGNAYDKYRLNMMKNPRTRQAYTKFQTMIANGQMNEARKYAERMNESMKFSRREYMGLSVG